MSRMCRNNHIGNYDGTNFPFCHVYDITFNSFITFNVNYSVCRNFIDLLLFVSEYCGY